ncbi:MAG: hypothetical protein JO281_20530 [Pseudonocardiales bacterium]|nr:hypothetical protein [Pseudonocardiales bacterium]
MHLQNTRTSAQPSPGQQGAAGGPLLTFNYLPARFVEARFDAGTFPYESSEQMEDLWTRLAETHTVIRLGNQVVCVPFVVDAESVGKPATFGTGGPDLALATRLLRAALMRVLTRRWGFPLRKFDPLTFVSRRPGRDLMENALKGQRAIDGLHVYPEYQLDVRRSGPTGQPGIIVGLKTRYEIELPVSELVRHGVPVVGRYALMPSDTVLERPFQDPVARRKLFGAIEAVAGGRLKLGTTTGAVEVAASDAWIEPRRDNFLAVVAAVAGASHTRIADALDREVFKLTGAGGRMARTEEIADGLVKLGPLTIANDVQAVIGKPVDGTGGPDRVSSRRLWEPTFVFDFGGDKTHRYPDQGLNEFGPFDSEAFTPKAPRIAVVAPRQFQGAVEGFISSFRNGVRGGEVFSQGFVRKYRLTDCIPVFTTFDGDVRDAAAYRQACLDAVAGTDRIDLAVVITSAEQEHLTGNASPYLVAKSTFMSHGVPVQEFQVENINRADIAHPLNTMALACYAKLGGTPYVISVPRRAMAHELVFGIGSSYVRQSRMGPHERFVGVTTVFNSEGNYFVSNVSRDALYDQYPHELLRALRVCIEDVKERNAWQPQDTIRLVFHVFKPLRDRETRAVKELVEGLTKEYAGVDFAFLHVSDQHPWMMLDRASNGIRHGRRVKGQFVPERGHAVRISRSELLVSVSGPRDLKLPSQGAPRPLLLKLHRESTFTDLDYLAGQVFRFTALSWRRPYPSSKPVTILYSDLIAGLLGQLRQVTNWNSDMISTTLRWSRWFL